MPPSKSPFAVLPCRIAVLGLCGLSGIARAETTEALGEAAEPIYLEAGPEWAVVVSAQIRPRVVAHSGLDFRGEDSEWREHVSQRSRLGLRAETPSGLAARLELSDVRLWGEEASPEDPTADGLDLHQAHVDLPLHADATLSLGRLELSLDDERLVGREDFTQRARAFDGGRLAWRSVTGRFAVDVLYAKIRESGTSPDGAVPAGVVGDVDFGAVHGAVELLPGQVLSPGYFVRIDHAPSHVRHTTGIHAAGEAGGFSYRLEGYYQYGLLDSEAISAYLGALRVGYTLPHALSPSAALFGELHSGDGTPGGAFDPLYGSTHPYLGEMDLFSGPADTAFHGIIDVGARLETGIVRGLRVGVDAHWLRTATELPDAGSSDLGIELDTRVTWWPMPRVTLVAFGGLFLPGSGVRGLVGPAPQGALHADFLGHVTTNVAF